jgi:FO synthase
MAFDLSHFLAKGARQHAALAKRPLPDLLGEADEIRQRGHGRIVSYSRKVFAPLTHLCRDSCGYCTFAKRPRAVRAPYMSLEEVRAVAESGAKAGCKELLFTLGDKPELRYREATDWLEAAGHRDTFGYLRAAAAEVVKRTRLLPHINAGIMTPEEMAAMREVSVSQGLMLESISPRLCEKGGPHYGSPDKHPAVRLAMIEAAGELAIPFTTGILIGIGETPAERVASLLAIAELDRRHGHIQEVIIQNFRAKPDTRMACAAEPAMDDLLWTAAVARLILGPQMNIQSPPNLSFDDFPQLLSAGINDWGGVSPVTPDFVNPEAPWPTIARLARASASRGYQLVERLAVYPSYAREPARWQAPAIVPRVFSAMDMDGFAREDDWAPGTDAPVPMTPAPFIVPRPRSLDRVLSAATAGSRFEAADIVRLFAARGPESEDIIQAADEQREKAVGDTVRYVVNRNINYTNVCYFHCRFCAFSKGKTHEELRGRPYDLSLEEVARRTREAWARGATEVCMQGGINPDYTGETYVELLRAVKEAAPQMHVHAFSPLEISQGARSLGIDVASFLARLKDEGLGTLPGTAAEILDDEVRRVLCPDKINTAEWLNVIASAHRVGLRSTATIMFGHMEQAQSWAAHLLAIRDLQESTGGFTEFVPLPFVHFEAPLYLKGQARRGPSWRETLLMHAVARLVLHPLIVNIQTSWVKLGPDGVKLALAAGVNDLGGTLMNESISRAAGTAHGQELPPARMDALIREAGRQPAQRTTLYGEVDAARVHASYRAAPLASVVQTPLRDRRAEPVSLQR